MSFFGLFRPQYAIRRSQVPALRDVPNDLLDGIAVSPDQNRTDCKAMLEEIPALLAPAVTSRKRQYDLVEAMTGIPARRLKDLLGGNVADPPGSQVRTIRNALMVAKAVWRERALKRLKHIEAESALLRRIDSDSADRTGDSAVDYRGETGALGEGSA